MAVNNPQIYTAAFAGAMAGMGFSDRIPTDPLPAGYAELSATAGAFASEIDTLWGVTPAASLEIQGMQSVCEAVWQSRTALTTSVPASWVPICKAVIVAIQEAISYYATNGIPNPPFGGGGGPAFTFPNRIDCSVNSGSVESPYSDTPVLHAQSGGHVAGGYNGGGVGNKSILGFIVGNFLPLAALTSIVWTWKDLNSPTPGLNVYANLVCDINGDGSAYKILVVDPSSLPILNNGTTVTNGDGSKTTTFLAASMNVLVVQGLPVPPLPPGGPGFIAPDEPPALIPPYGLPGGWPGVSYKISTILAAYPAARLAIASSGDGGMPKAPNKTPPFMLVTGDSTNQLIRAFRLSNVTFNGVAV